MMETSMAGRVAGNIDMASPQDPALHPTVSNQRAAWSAVFALSLCVFVLIASEFLPLIAYGIPLDFFASAVQQYGAVTQAEVQRVARQYVNPDKLTIVLVGDRKVIEPGIRALKPGEIVTRDVRDVLGAPPTP